MRTLLVCLLVACGGSSGGGDDTPGASLPPDQYVDAREAAACEAGVRCEEYADLATCEAANILVDQEMKTLLAAVADGSVDYDGEAAKACVDWLAELDCTFPGFHSNNPCDDIFTGTVPPGGACFIDQQCANGGECGQDDPSCDTDVSCCLGRCAGTVTESPIGGPCGEGQHTCPENAYCAGGTCTAVVANDGGACTEIDACASPMYCALDGTGGGVCKQPAASGAPCVRSEPLPCADSRDYCSATSMTCVRSAQPGASCASGVVCVDYAKCVSNQCVADLAPGAACMPLGASCAGTHECVGGTCTAPPAGMTCAL